MVEYCGSQHQVSHLVCCHIAGHEGPHQATMDGTIALIWVRGPVRDECITPCTVCSLT